MRSEEVVALKEVVVMAYTVRQVGNAALMDLAKTSFLSSRKISPEAILRCYDWAIRMRDEGRCVISGFQSALEKDVLRFLLKGTQPIVLVLARRMFKIIPECFCGDRPLRDVVFCTLSAHFGKLFGR